MRYSRGRLIIFCKAPEPGKVKTRLASSLDASGLDGATIAAEIHKYLAIHCLGTMTSQNQVSVELRCSPSTDDPFFKQCAEEYGVILREQGPGDLGERMSRAFDDVLSKHDYAVIIGTDCPVLDFSVVDHTLSLLSTNQNTVIVPAEDGGYVLIGLTVNQPDIFFDMPWGTSKVLSQTALRVNGECEMLPPLWDVDTLEDLARLKQMASSLKLDDGFISLLNSLNI